MNRIIWVLILSMAPALAQPPGPGKKPEKPEGTPAPTSPNTFRTKVLAVVNRDIITEAEVWKKLKGVVEEMTPEKRVQARNSAVLEMIEQKVYDQAAARLKLQLDEKSLTQWIESRKEELGGEEGWRQMILEREVSEEQYVSEVAQGAKRNLYLRAQAGGVKALGKELRSDQVIEPTAREVRAYYQRHKDKEFTEESGAKVRAMLIRIRDGNREATLELAKEIKRDLETGADFTVLAEKHSRLARDTKGDLGWIKPDDAYNELILDYAFKGAKGSVSEPLEFRRGYFLVWVEDRREARTVPFKEAQRVIRQKLKDRNLQLALRSVRLKVLEEAWIQPASFKRALLFKYRRRR